MKVLVALNWKRIPESKSVIFPYKRLSINKSQINVVARSQCSQSIKVDYIADYPFYLLLAISPRSLEGKKSQRSLLIKSRYNQIAKSMKVRGLSRRRFFFFFFFYLRATAFPDLLSRPSSTLSRTLAFVLGYFRQPHIYPLPFLWSRDRSYGRTFQTVNCKSSNTTPTISRL